eukprot:TRINITY_DN1515_c0_g1_i2.p1 TRINITY_DN1515_c0_g1~~TRINITY_DN1515_c0_g1_i2.p1  ORF type:complete len:112 (+),score=21.41 TRINITY_DN1515_c0_g1_i2:44-379(+)
MTEQYNTSCEVKKYSPRMKMVKIVKRKFFDSADWVMNGEVCPVHPKLKEENQPKDGDNKKDLCENQTPRDRYPHLGNKTAVKHALRQTRKLFDSADWMLSKSCPKNSSSGK